MQSFAGFLDYQSLRAFSGFFQPGLIKTWFVKVNHQQITGHLSGNDSNIAFSAKPVFQRSLIRDMVLIFSPLDPWAFVSAYRNYR
jgi:hypothetical protein